MSQKDYILRIAEEVGRALAQVLYNRQIKDYAAAHTLIDQQSKQAFGMGIGFMRSIPDETLLSMLTSFDTLDTERCWLLAIFLKADGDIYKEQENVSESYYSYVKSLNLVLEVLLLEKTGSERRTIQELEDLLSRLNEFELPIRTQLLLFKYYEHAHQYAKAEDLLFEMFGADDKQGDIFQHGMGFYQRLKSKSDAELYIGNFSSGEVEEGLAQLKKLQN